MTGPDSHVCWPQTFVNSARTDADSRCVASVFMAPMRKKPMTGILRCHHCRDLIGVYEPLIVLIDGQTHETSRTCIQESVGVVEECYHRDCYAGSQRDEPGLS